MKRGRREDMGRQWTIEREDTWDLELRTFPTFLSSLCLWFDIVNSLLVKWVKLSFDQNRHAWNEAYRLCQTSLRILPLPFLSLMMCQALFSLVFFFLTFAPWQWHTQELLSTGSLSWQSKFLICMNFITWLLREVDLLRWSTRRFGGKSPKDSICHPPSQVQLLPSELSKSYSFVAVLLSLSTYAVTNFDAFIRYMSWVT